MNSSQIVKPKMSLNIKKFSPKDYWIPTFVVLILLALFMFVIFPQIKDLSENRKRIKEAKVRVQKLQEKDNNLKSLEEGEVFGFLRTAEEAIPSKPSVPEVISALYRLSATSGVSVQGFSLSSTKNAAAPATDAPSANLGKTLEFQVILRGPLEAIQGFLSNYEKVRRAFIVEQVSATSTDGSFYDLTLKVSAPYEEKPPLPEDFAESLPARTSLQEQTLANINKSVPLNTPVGNEPTGKTNPFQ